MCLFAHVREPIVRTSTYGEMYIKRNIIVSFLNNVLNRAIKIRHLMDGACSTQDKPRITEFQPEISEEMRSLYRTG